MGDIPNPKHFTQKNKMKNKKDDQEILAEPSYNIAGNYVERVGNIADKISNYSITGNYKGFYYSLNALFREISPYIDSTNKTKIIKKLKQVVYCYKKCTIFKEKSEEIKGKLKQSERDLFLKQSAFYWRKFTELLNEVHILLLNYVQEMGLLMPSKKDKTIIGGSE